MDHSASTGLVGAAFAAARSYQPNLLTRASRDQAIITGVTSAAAYGIFSAGDSVLEAVASRVSRTEHPSGAARLLVAGVVGAAGAGTAAAVRWREHEAGVENPAVIDPDRTQVGQRRKYAIVHHCIDY